MKPEMNSTDVEEPLIQPKNQPRIPHFSQLAPPHWQGGSKRPSLRNSNWSWQKMPGADLAGVDLSEAQLLATCLIGANLRSANLSRAKLAGADLQKANLCQADLSLASLVWADLKWADLRNANLDGADLRWADLRGINLKNAQLTNVIWNSQTQWPSGFAIEPETSVGLVDIQ